MTAYEISIREQEIELLEELKDGDDDISKHKFRDLWYGEKGDDTYDTMIQIWKDMGHPNTWSIAEEKLLKLVKDEPTYIQPFALLSKLYCLQGKFDDSKIICEAILKIKPYHFMVIETMIANCYGSIASKGQQQGDEKDGGAAADTGTVVAVDDEIQMQLWLMKRLPPPQPSALRIEWVKRAVSAATLLLEEAKERNEPKSSGGSDTDGIIGSSIKTQTDHKDDDNTQEGETAAAWQ